MKVMQKMKRGLLVVGFFFLLSGSTVQAANTQKVSGTQRYDYAYKVLEIVNKERKKAGRSKLTMDEELLEAAMLRAAELEVSFDHMRPNGTDCFSVSKKSYGENIAMGYSDPQTVMNGWMNSKGHKTNILNKGYSSIGIGCFETKSYTYWVQCFGYDAADKTSKPDNQKVTYQVSRTSSKETVLLTGNKSTIAKVKGVTVRSGKKKLTLQWSEQAKASGYEIQIAANKSFKGKQTYKVKAGQSSKTISKINGKKLKNNKRYYIRIRAYRKGNGTKKGKWKVVNKKTK